MRTLPGFTYDKNTKTARFSCYVKGGKGKTRRERTIKIKSIEEAREEWSRFRKEISRAGASDQVTFEKFIELELPRVCKNVRPTMAPEACGIRQSAARFVAVISQAYFFEIASRFRTRSPGITYISIRTGRPHRAARVSARTRSAWRYAVTLPQNTSGSVSRSPSFLAID